MLFYRNHWVLNVSNIIRSWKHDIKINWSDSLDKKITHARKKLKVHRELSDISNHENN